MGYTRGYQSVGVGDPFIHSKIIGVLGGIGRGALGALGQALTGVAGGGIPGSSGAQPVTATVIQETVPQPTAFPGGFTPSVGETGGNVFTGKKASGGIRGQTSRTRAFTKRRRMNVLNVKALRRSTRRLAGFQREAKKVEKELRKLAPPSRRRTPSHHHHTSVTSHRN